jgi:hypothetical protein
MYTATAQAPGGLVSSAVPSGRAANERCAAIARQLNGRLQVGPTFVTRYAERKLGLVPKFRLGLALGALGVALRLELPAFGRLPSLSISRCHTC